MPKLLLINPAKNFGSTGKIVEQIGLLAESSGWEVKVAHSVRYARISRLKSMSFSSKIGERWHALWALLLDRQGLHSTIETRRLVQMIIDYQPDLIHLHNIHGYYINYIVLFKYLASIDVPVVWTMHDCWSFTGHCTYFDMVNCEKWKSQCYECQNLVNYPKALTDRSRKNFQQKKEQFTSLKNLTMIPVSNWLGELTRKSFMGKYPIHVIHNGIDLNVFRILTNYQAKDTKKMVLGVSSNGFSGRKGLDDFVTLSKILPDEYQIVMIGLHQDELAKIPINIVGMGRTANVEELVEYYNRAAVFINPTYSDNFPTTNLEALACGTPVVTYNTGGSPEAVDETTGIVVKQGDVKELASAIMKITNNPKPSLVCRKRAVELFDKDRCFDAYLQLYDYLISK
ncbi:Glycosyltransferase involved in cell wall bisynthesis [Xylanibacter ruminicola]|uniref:Glycosyltransferase involved in cell wall bisynthesis n=2 Tax=Xylanibacter ruminicola TaxID=839 RepID=A0A1H4C4D1_XYLRU|nr:Glycosyltransferase involved in cell wall bisynthesis [Xylanibacter ruminicola]